MATTIEFNLGDVAPLNTKASNSDEALCFACGRKLGKNAFHFEVSTDWTLIDPNKANEDSQGCFPVGQECAKKFASNLLVKVDA